ncbi:MAG TPA: glucose-6-phosphate isomerase family protein [Candidatus Dojkabacteria bacterium]|jgi:oxalate decarboxylase/phosphoglucose isomerase-like protein (cupin superfamily)
MRSLQDLSSLPIYFDEKDTILTIGEEVLLDERERISLKSLIPGLLNKALIYPVEVYEEHRNLRYAHDDEKIGRNITYDILFLPEGLLGIEYIKSHIYYSPNGNSPGITSTIIEVIMGSITIFLQKNATRGELDFETTVEDVIIIDAREGEKVVLPKGYFYTFINTSESPVIISRVYRNKGIADYVSLKKEQGLSYFCIRKNARREFVKNPKYIIKKELEEKTSESTLCDTCLTSDKPLYNQLVEQTNEFLDMLWN